MKKLVVVGAGFAGVQLVKKLKNSNYDITLVDIHNYHQFQPLFYQVASAKLEPSTISTPLRKLFQGQPNLHIRLGKVENIDTNAKTIQLHNQDIFSYDILVLATGCTNNYFGNANVEKYAFPMKSTTQAIALRNRILLNFEESLSVKPEERTPYQNIVIVGGGPTGVETAGALAEMKKNVLPKDYPDYDFSNIKIYLVEGLPFTLAPMSDTARKASRQYLEELGIEVQTEKMLTEYDGSTITFKDGSTIVSNTLIWSAGVIGNVPAGIPNEIIVRGRRILVDEYHAVKDLENVYAIGDISAMNTDSNPNGYPQLANVANKQADSLAENLKALSNGQPVKKFTYKSPGTMATVGKWKAVVDMPKFSFKGWFAWLTWMLVHIMLIYKCRNKKVIFRNWLTSFFTNDSYLRNIFIPTEKAVQQTEKYPEKL